MADRNYGPQESSGSLFSIINIVFIVVSLILIYYLYRYLYTAAYTRGSVLIPSQIQGNVPPPKLPSFPAPYEGGDYSVNMWIYVSSFKTANTRKHLFELQGVNFSTLLIGLGAFKNSLVVRTQYVDPMQGFQNPPTSYTNSIINRVKSIMNGGAEGFQAGGSGSGLGPGSGSGSGSKPPVVITGIGSGSGSKPPPSTPPPTTTTQTPSTNSKPGNLSKASITAMFTPMASDDSLLTAPPVCDVPEIDLQRWTMVSVVISGRNIDVYIDGKLSRSCSTPSYFKVDPTIGMKVNIADRGGFDGYIGNTMVGSYVMSPDEIYKAYLSGPNGTSLDLFSWLASLFNGARIA
jgi:hypothetical protein